MTTIFPEQPSENLDPWYNAETAWKNKVEEAINLRLVPSRGPLADGVDLNTLSGAENSGLWRIYPSRSHPNLPPNPSTQTAGLLVMNTQTTSTMIYMAFNRMAFRTAPTTVFGGWRELVTTENLRSSLEPTPITSSDGWDLDTMGPGEYVVHYLHVARELGLPNRVGKLTIQQLTPTIKIQKYETNQGDIAGNGVKLPYELWVRGMDYDREFYPSFEKILPVASDESGMDMSVSQTVYATHAKATYTEDLTYYRKNSSTLDSPASTTKVFSGYLARKVISDSKLDDKITVLSTDRNPGGSGSETPLMPGDIVSIRDLFYLSMLPSHNQAVSILARVAGELLPGTGDPYDKFITNMQVESDALGWTGAIWVNPTGLGTTTNKTSVDYMIDLMYKVATDTFLVECMGRQSHQVEVEGPNARSFEIRHTVNSDGAVKFPDMVAAKSGTITGTACLVMLYRKSNNTYGAAALFRSNSANRYKDMRQIINYAVEGRDRQYLVG